MKKSILLFPLLLLFTSCGSHRNVSSLEMPFAKVYTAAWMQRAAEYDALCYQAFNGARLYLDQSLSLMQEDSKPLAIVTDIDETILDNSPNAVHQGIRGELFDTKEWTRWVNRVEADTIPGALSFLQYAADNGVEIFYITNRNEQERQGTLLNLQKFGFPNADDAHLMLKSNTSNKDERRAKVMEEYEVVIYMGDQLTDFPGYYKASEEDRSALTQKDANTFGGMYIVLPNPNYGEWESALSGYKRLDKIQQAELIKKKAKTY